VCVASLEIVFGNRKQYGIHASVSANPNPKAIYRTDFSEITHRPHPHLILLNPLRIFLFPWYLKSKIGPLK